MANSPEPPVLEFSSASLFREWLQENQENQTGIMLRIYKKQSGVQSITYDEALDEALCFGWIDGIKKKYDALSWIQKFTPRRPKSMWSKRNIKHIERLKAEGKMMPRGLNEAENAQKDGRWEQAYDSQRYSALPDEFLNKLKKDPQAYQFYLSLNAANKYAIAFRLQTAKKPETLKRRSALLLAMLKQGLKFH